jgi:hypothetical protein
LTSRDKCDILLVLFERYREYTLVLKGNEMNLDHMGIRVLTADKGRLVELIAALKKEPAENTRMFSIMNSTGDLELNWDPSNEEDAAMANEVFQILKRAQFSIMVTKPNSGGLVGSQADALDPEMDTIAHGLMVGGNL